MKCLINVVVKKKRKKGGMMETSIDILPLPYPNTRGVLNKHTHEFHNRNAYTEHCNLDEIKDSVRLSWKAAKELEADACGHCFPGASEKNDTKLKKKGKKRKKTCQ